jgi:hypothetical protein
MESKVDGDYAVFWVEVADDLSTNPVTIYIYYGNPTATSISDGDATFLFFDDFESYTAGQNLPTTKWPYQTAGWKIYQDTTGKVVRYEGGDTVTGGNSRAINNVNVSGGFAVEALMRSESGKDAGVLICATSDVTSKYGYNYFIGWGSSGSTAYIYYMAGTSATQLAFYSNAVPTTYTRVTVTHRSDGLMKLIRAGTVLVSATHTTYTSGYIGVEAWYSLYPASYWDWIAVRKYVEPEPAHGSWGSEETVAILETIVAMNFPMDYLPSPAKAVQLISKVSGATITKISQDYPAILIKSGKAQELRSKFST